MKLRRFRSVTGNLFLAWIARGRGGWSREFRHRERPGDAHTERRRKLFEARSPNALEPAGTRGTQVFNEYGQLPRPAGLVLQAVVVDERLQRRLVDRDGEHDVLTALVPVPVHVAKVHVGRLAGGCE